MMPYRRRDLPYLPDAVALAIAAYDERDEVGVIDPLRLSILADALEETGADADIVTEVRADVPRYRGYWVIDQLLEISNVHAEASAMAR